MCGRGGHHHAARVRAPPATSVGGRFGARVRSRARATDLAFARSNPAPTFARRVSAAASGDPESGHREHSANHDDLVAALHGLTGDPLEADGGRVVVYRGDPRAKIMIIGEAPGAEEDKLGVPFVGRLENSSIRSSPP